MKRNKLRRSEEQYIVLESEPQSSSIDFGSLGSVDSISSDPRAIWLTSDIYPETVYNIIKDIVRINYEDDRKEKEYAIDGQSYTRTPIKLYISSYGGSCYDGLGIIGAIKSSKTPVHTYSVGKVMSMGLFIAVSGHSRFTYPHTTYMYHSVSSMSWGTVKDLEESAEETRRLQTVLDDHLLSFSTYTQEQLTSIQDKKQDHYISATEALALGMVDEVI